MNVYNVQDRAELAGEQFIGGPVKDFARVGQHCLEVLKAEGMLKTSRVLDFGCGSLRAGGWLIEYLEPGNYYGIEPSIDMVKVGMEIFPPEIAERVDDDHFSSNDAMDMAVFGESFDYVLARSVWTHASKNQIDKMLGSFANSTAPEGKLLASYRPASIIATRLQRRFPSITNLFTTLPLAELSPVIAKLPLLEGSKAQEYQGTEWAGISHLDNRPRSINHSLSWISKTAIEHGLDARLVPHEIINNQYWVRVQSS